MARVVAARHSQGLPPARCWPGASPSPPCVLAVLVVATIAGHRPLADRLFAGDGNLVAVLIGALAAMAVAYTTRGVLSGLQLFPWYGTQLGVDGGLRIVWSPCSAWRRDRPGLVRRVLVVAPLVGAGDPATGAARHRRRRPRRLGHPATRPRPAHRLQPALPGRGQHRRDQRAAARPRRRGTAGALLSALVLVRIPLFVFGSMQASLLPGLATTATTGDQAGFHSLLRRALGVVTALGVTGALGAVAARPVAGRRRLFDAPGVLGHGDFAWLAAATLAYLWAMVLGQALLALDRHRAQALAWTIGVAALIAVTLIPAPVALRVELAYAIGSVVVAATMAVLLLRGGIRRPPPPPPGRSPTWWPPASSGGL